MTLSPARPAEPGVRGPVVIPPTPVTVLVTQVVRYATVHDGAESATATRCGLSVLPFTPVWLADLVVQRLEPHFCDGCWPGARCVICGVPSGGSNECERCLATSIEIDKRFARAA